MKQALYLFIVSFLLQVGLFAQAPNISYTNPIQTYTVGYEITPLNVANAGGAITYGQTTTPISIGSTHGVVVDASGNVYFPRFGYNSIFKISPTGLFSVLAGNDTSGSTDGLKTAASFNYPHGVAVDASGNVYVADTDNHKIRKITSGGVVSTIAGSGVSGSTDGIGTATSFYYPYGVAIDASGNIYVADTYNHKIRKITTGGMVSTLAGGATTGNPDGIGTAASFNYPAGVAVDAAGNVFVAEVNKIRKVTPAGVVSTLVAGLNQARGIALDASGNIYVAEASGNKIRKIATGGIVTTLAGSAIAGSLDGMGTTASFSFPTGVAVDASGNVYVAESKAIRKINTTGGYSISPALPLGLYIDSSTGAISGKPSVETPQSTYTVKAANSYGNSSYNIKISTGYFKPNISYNTPQVYSVGTTISLQATNTGSDAKSWSITPSLPTGLYFDTSHGDIGGSATVITPATTYTVTATNSYGSGNFNVVISTGNYRPIITYPTPQAYTVGNAITPLLPINTGLSATSYFMSIPLPTGLTLNATTGVISGTPTKDTPARSYDGWANNSYGSGSFEINIGIGQKPAISYITSQTYTIGIAITPLQPINTGSQATNYSITPTLPTGLALNTTTGVISGTPTITSVQTLYTVSATNAYGLGVATVAMAIKVNDLMPVIRYISSQIYTVGTAIIPLYPTNTGGLATSYFINPNLVLGLTLNTVTGVISGTPAVASQTSYTVWAKNIYGTGLTIVEIGVKPAGTKPVISYTTPQTYTVGTAVTPLQPTNSGGTVTSYAVAPILPMGLTLNTATGVISGAPTVASAQTSYTVSAMNAYGTGTTTVIITINAAVTKPAISYTTPQTYTVGTVITPLQPTNTGSPVTNYSISPSLPNGLVLNTTTGVISGTSTVATPATTYTVTGTNTGGSSSTIISITIDRVLPSNNFTIESKGETCTNSNNGEISITAKEIFPYVANINGKSYLFTNNSLKVASLTPGTYTITITIPGEIFEQSFTVVIAKGATITGKSSVFSNKIAVEIAEGTAPYTVFVNGVEQFETTSSSFSVDLKKGGLLEVKTAKACEGIYAKEIAGLESAVSAYPNPTSGSFEIELPTLRKEVVIALYTLDGHLISKKTYTIENGKVQLTLENQPTGTYIAKIELDTPDYLKIIKN